MDDRRTLTVGSDSAVVRRHRAHQGRWREEVLGLPAGRSANPRAGNRVVDSMLPTEHEGTSAADGGWNLMSPAAVDYARTRLPEVRGAGGLAEPDRLWRNMLSSQPLAFSLVGELRAHPGAALAALSDLIGHRLVAFDRITTGSAAHDLDGLQAEWAPPSHDHTGDRSGFDVAAAARTEDGRSLLLTVEVKYTDDFSRAPLDPPAYAAALERLGIGADTAARLVAGGASQFLRSVLLTDSVRRGGRSGQRTVDEVLAVVLCRDDDATPGGWSTWPVPRSRGSRWRCGASARRSTSWLGRSLSPTGPGLCVLGT
jgi:hypothetical protein